MKAVIGGTGIDRDERFSGNSVTVETEYGSVECSIIDGIVYLPRHSATHAVPPHLINYRANIEALSLLSVDRVISIYAVGSITKRITPASFGLVRDFIDLTYGRKNTFFDKGGDFRHTPMVQPFDRETAKAFLAVCLSHEYSISYDSVYVTTNGPRLETAAEIAAYRRMGADIVGMTLGTEAVLLAEKGIKNAAVAYSINWAAGLDDEGVSFLEDESIARLSARILSLSEETLALF